MAFGFGKKKKDDLFEDEELGLPPLPGLPEEEELGLPEEEEEEEFEMPAPPIRPMRQPSMPSVPTKPAKPTRPLERAPVFIKIDKYKELMKTVQSMQTKIDELQDTLEKISSIKSKEKEIIEGWGSLLTEVKGKVSEVNSKILRPGE